MTALSAVPSALLWEEVVCPIMREFFNTPTELKTIFSVVWALDSFFEHVFWEANPSADKYDMRFLQSVPGALVIHEVSNSIKHAVRDQRRNPKTAGSAAVKVRPRGFGEAEFGVDAFGDHPIPLVEYLNGQSSSISHAVSQAQVWANDTLGLHI